MRSIPAAQANRQFSKLLAEVKRGRTVTITSHGQPIAKLVPFLDSDDLARRQAARERLLAHLDDVPPRHLGKFDRDMAYDD